MSNRISSATHKHVTLIPTDRVRVLNPRVRIRAYGLRMPSELRGGKYSPGELILIDGTVLEHDKDRMIDMNVLVHEGTEHHSVITHSGQIVDFNGAELTLRRFTEALVPDLPEPYMCFATDKIAVHRILSVEDLV